MFPLGFLSKALTGRSLDVVKDNKINGIGSHFFGLLIPVNVENYFFCLF